MVDITWFTFRLYKLTGRRGMAILYLYSFLGFAILRGVTPDFGALSGKEYFLEGAFRCGHLSWWFEHVHVLWHVISDYFCLLAAQHDGSQVQQVLHLGSAWTNLGGSKGCSGCTSSRQPPGSCHGVS